MLARLLSVLFSSQLDDDRDRFAIFRDTTKDTAGFIRITNDCIRYTFSSLSLTADAYHLIIKVAERCAKYQTIDNHTNDENERSQHTSLLQNSICGDETRHNDEEYQTCHSLHQVSVENLLVHLICFLYFHFIQISEYLTRPEITSSRLYSLLFCIAFLISSRFSGLISGLILCDILTSSVTGIFTSHSL